MQTPSQTQQDSDERAANPFARLDHGLTPFTLARLRERAERGRSAGYRVVDITPNHLEQLLDIAEKRAVRS